jgi:colanic acid/amylovoran biosynthesis glycosyltransferase
MLPISEHWRRRLLELGCPPEKVRVFRMGVALDTFEFRPRRAEGAPVSLLSVGRLVEKKGFEFGLRAFAGALHAHPGLRYDIAGDGPLREPLERLARELGLAERVRFHGRLLRSEVEQLRRRANILLAPSVTDGEGDQEGIPVVIMEAMASGIPVISTRHSGIPELVVDGETGLLAPERDAPALVAALDRLLAESELSERLARAARERVAALHDQARLNDELAQLLGEVTARQS